MRIGIDARFYGPVGKGLGRYTARLIEHLEQILPEDHECLVFLRRENFGDYTPKNPRFRKVLADYSWYSFQEQLLFPFTLRKHHLDVVHFPHFNVPLLYRYPFVVTIHDLILLRYPTARNTTKSALVYWLKFLAYRVVIGSAVRRARKILTVSRFTERDLLVEYPQTSGNVVVAYEGCDLPIAASDPMNAEDRRGILKPYFLYVGNAYPHKNLEAFIPLARHFPDIRFVLVGREDYFYRRLRKRIEEEEVDNILFTGFVPDTELVDLYTDATGYVFPSLYEGFGLPPLEAMRQGTPVVAARRGSLPEILGESALFFDPDRDGDLERVVQRLMDDSDLAAKLSCEGKKHTEGFRWEDLASVTLRVYEESVEE